MVSDKSARLHCASFGAILAKFDRKRIKKIGKSALEKTQDAALEVKARLKNHNGTHFEPLHCPEDDEDENESDTFSSGRTESQSSSSSSTSQMSRDEEIQCSLSRTHQMERLQKQTGRAQLRSNIRARYGLAPDMLDTAFVLGSKMIMRQDNNNNATSVRNG